MPTVNDDVATGLLASSEEPAISGGFQGIGRVCSKP
jgi:hypothetical protein